MRCPKCDHENSNDAGFCGDCGRTLSEEVTCPKCGRLFPPGERFCQGCGNRLSDALSTPTPTPTPLPALPASFASGRYQVQRFIGEGGKKRVYLAHDSNLDRDVAIALIKSEGLTEEGIARVQREFAELPPSRHPIASAETFCPGRGTALTRSTTSAATVPRTTTSATDGPRPQSRDPSG